MENYNVMKNQISKENLLPITKKQLDILKKIKNNFSKKQLIWLSGYIYGLIEKYSENKEFTEEKSILLPNQNATSITIISASQTGNARSIAENLYQNFISLNLSVKLFHARDYPFKKIAKEKILIIIVSTQGEGEPPEEAILLYNFLNSKKAPKLENTMFSVFGLGDSSYEFFSKAGKDLDNILFKLGGIRILERVDADIEYETTVSNWKKKIVKIIQEKVFTMKQKVEDNIFTLEKNENKYKKENPFLASVLINQKITGRYSYKDIRHIEISLKNSSISYTPGDALGVWYENNIFLAKNIIKILNLDEKENVLVNNINITLLDALRFYFELTINTYNTVKKYFLLAKNKKLFSLISSKDKLKKYAIQTPILEMIKKIPIKITSQDFIKILRPLKPRLYSISSSQLEFEEEVHITVNIIRYKVNNEIYFGGASGYLSERKEDDKIRIYIEKNNNFRLPKDPKVPIIMIGPGTGIAPFRAFMQERENTNILSKNWLFFGNQHFTEDFLYQLEWQNYLKTGLLSKIDLAWSRDQENKIYVQDKIREKGSEFWNWIQDGANIYICGDANNMAKDVESVILEIISKNGKMNLEESKEYLNKLRSMKRYQRDVY